MHAITSFFTSPKNLAIGNGVLKIYELRKVWNTFFPDSKYVMVQGMIINGRWTIGERLGAGSFGQVHIGTDSVTKKKVAIKLEKLSADEHQLAFENKVYRKIGLSGYYFPEILYYGTIEGYNVMIMQILGPSLEDVFSMCGRKFSLKTITMIGIQMLKRLKHIHRSDYLHRDVKPDNFCIGAGAKDNTIFAVDFGLAKRFKDSDRRHMDINYRKGLTGTARYASLNSHNGIELSRRDDLAALAYVLAYFHRGSLPWQGIRCDDNDEKYRQIRKKKLEWSNKELFKGAPKQFVQFFDYVDSLEFKEKPDYDKLENLLVSVLQENNYTQDNVFDWMKNAKYLRVKLTRCPDPPPVIAPKVVYKPPEKKKRKTKSQKKREARAAGIPIPMKPKYIPKAVREKLGLTCKHVPRGTTLAALQQNAVQVQQNAVQISDAKSVVNKETP